MSIGDNIRIARKTKQISINKLSKLSGISLGFLSDIENNKTNSSITTLTKIAQSLAIPLSDLIRQPKETNVEDDVKLSPEYYKLINAAKDLPDKYLKLLNEVVTAFKEETNIE